MCLQMMLMATSFLMPLGMIRSAQCIVWSR
jgi:hypothetical protein